MKVYEKLSKYYDLLYGKKDKILAECDFLETIFKKYIQYKPTKILDIGCGTGNHALILADRNYNVVAIDQSTNMIKEAKKKSKKNKVQFFAKNMIEFKLEEKVDCAICFFNSFGYITNQIDLEHFFSNLYFNLKDESLFVFEFWNIGGIKPTPYKNWTKRQLENLSLYRIEETDFQVETNILESNKEFIIIENGKLLDNFLENHKIKCYTISEITQLVENNRFEILNVFSFDKTKTRQLKKPERKNLRMIAIAKKKK